MGIYIKGMAMPKNGKYILCSIRADGKVITDLITGGCEEYEAIELPPHGDLIDRDATMKSACEALCHLGVFCPDNLCKEVRETFDAVPTVIESEE